MLLMLLDWCVKTMGSNLLIQMLPKTIMMEERVGGSHTGVRAPDAWGRDCVVATRPQSKGWHYHLASVGGCTGQRLGEDRVPLAFSTLLTCMCKLKSSTAVP